MKRTYLTDSYRYRPGEGWTKLADLPRPAVAAGSPAHLQRGSIWIFGGDTGELAEQIPVLKENHPGFPHTTLVYDPATDRWAELDGLPFSQLTTSLTAIDDRPVLVSGEDRPGHRAPACWIADWPAAEARTFVEGGRPVAVREDGGTWQSGEGWLERQGMGPILWGDRAIGEGDFTATARLAIHGLAKSAASVSIDGKSHFGFEGAGGKPFLSGGIFGAATRFVDEAWVQDGQPFTLTIQRRGKTTTFAIDGKDILSAETGAGRFGSVGLRPWRSTMRVYDFRVEGKLGAALPPKEQPQEYTVPIVDLAGKVQQVVIAQGTKDVYQGHPTTLLMPDNKTMFAVWTIGHGGTCGPLKRSDDAGLTWSEQIPVPENWTTTRNCPAIHRLVDPEGKARLIVLAGNGDMMQSISEDEGRTWTPMTPNGLRCVVTPNTVIKIPGNRYLGIYHRGPESKDRSPLRIWQATTADGGLTWQDERGVGQREAADLCEPALIRSPDGRRLACIMRENARRYNSFIMFSDDDGEHWSTPVEVPAALTGDRHLARYAPDGRLLMVFRDTAHTGPTRGDFVGWVGTFDDLVNLNEGQYRFRLFTGPKKFDLGYPGLELVPDGTFVATTYAQLAEDEKHSVVSFRFKIDDLDQALAAGQVVKP